MTAKKLTVAAAATHATVRHAAQRHNEAGKASLQGYMQRHREVQQGASMHARCSTPSSGMSSRRPASAGDRSHRIVGRYLKMARLHITSAAVHPPHAPAAISWQQLS